MNMKQLVNCDAHMLTSHFLSKVRLTPRSVEAFWRSGLQPRDIVYPRKEMLCVD